MGDNRGRAGHHAIPRFFVERVAVSEQRILLTPDQQHQARRVLRLQAGDRIRLCDGAGTEYLCALRYAADELWAEPYNVERGRPEPGCRVALFQSPLRGDRFTWVLQKGTEVGVTHFVPVLFERTQHADYVGRGERFAAVVREAAEQCERAVLPVVSPPLAFERALDMDPSSLRILLDERESRRTLKSCLEAAPVSVSLYVGPEGGFTASEHALARQRGLISATLGERILRSETAGVVAAALVLYATGDLG